MGFRAKFLVGLVASALSASMARASLTINFRFADGSTTHALTPADVGHDVEIDVWATITGNNPPSQNNFYGLTYVYYNAVSALPEGAGSGVDGAIDANANALVTPFNAVGSQVGVTQDINGDGVADVGSNLVATEINKPSAVFVPPDQLTAFNDEAGVTGNDLSNGFEFEVEKLFFHVNSLALGETEFLPQIPSVASLLGPEYKDANWNQDSSNDTTGSPGSFMNGTPLTGSGVELISVPEPSGLAILLGICGLMKRRHTSK